MSELLTYHSFLTSLGFTIVVETCVVFTLLLFAFRERKLDTGLMLFACIFVNCATVPYVWFVVPGILGVDRSAAFWISEPFVFLVEALFYRVVLGIDMKKALVLWLAANAASYFLGPILRGLGIWLYW